MKDTEAYEMGRMDAQSVQKNMTTERPAEMIWLSPEEALESLEQETDKWLSDYYRGYLSRWD